MSTEYHKIQTAWLRDPETGFKTLIEGAWAKPEFEYLAGTKWVFTEKVDGTNMRLTLDGIGYRIGGKDGEALTRILSNGADTSDELKLWHMIKASIEADEGMLEAVRAEFAFDDWRHSVEEAV